MKFKLSKTEWERIGSETGWLDKTSYAISPEKPPVKMCERCGEKPSCEMTDDEGNVMGYSDYCEECDERMDMGPMCKLLKNLGPQEAKRVLEELTNDSKTDFKHIEPELDLPELDLDDDFPF